MLVVSQLLARLALQWLGVAKQEWNIDRNLRLLLLNGHRWFPVIEPCAQYPASLYIPFRQAEAIEAEDQYLSTNQSATSRLRC